VQVVQKIAKPDPTGTSKILAKSNTSADDNFQEVVVRHFDQPAPRMLPKDGSSATWWLIKFLVLGLQGKIHDNLGSTAIVPIAAVRLVLPVQLRLLPTQPLPAQDFPVPPEGSQSLHLVVLMWPA
jgi:hypothetical protein